MKAGQDREALARELASAREAIASAEKPSNVDVTARDAASPTGSRPMEGSNGASEITGSMPTPQSGGKWSADLFGSSGRRCNSRRFGTAHAIKPIPTCSISTAACDDFRRGGKACRPRRISDSSNSILPARGFCSQTPWKKGVHALPL